MDTRLEIREMEIWGEIEEWKKDVEMEKQRDTRRWRDGIKIWMDKERWRDEGRHIYSSIF